MLTWLVGAAAAPTVAASGMPIASDRIVLPPARREFTSPAGRYRLVVESTDGWKTPQPTAILLALDSAGAARSQWTRLLPHHHGPRFVLVTDDGQTLLVDEWINVRSRQTLMLLDGGGRVSLTAGSEPVLAALRAPPADVSSQARFGTWISEAPVLAADQRSARVSAGGRVLVVDLRSGALSSVAR